MTKRWQPVEVGQIKCEQDPEYIQASVWNGGRTMGVWYLDNGCSMTLPDNYRLCQLVEVDDPLAGIEAHEHYPVRVWPENPKYFTVTVWGRNIDFSLDGARRMIETLLYGLAEAKKLREQS